MRAWWVLLVVMLSGALPAAAQVRGTIVGPGSQAIALAVVPLANGGGDDSRRLGKEFARVLSRDLELSGYFSTVDPSRFPAGESDTGSTAAEVDFTGWQAAGAQDVIKGTVTVSGGSVVVEVRMLDVVARRDLPDVGRRYTGRPAEVARMAHRTADTILELLTGERGPFDSRIALVSNRGGILKEIYLYTFDMAAPQKLTNEQSLVVAPSWAPKGAGVLFTSYRDHQPALFQVDVASRRVGRVVGGSWVAGAWSPDGSRLAAVKEEGGNTDIYLLDAGGRVLQRLTDHWGIDVSPAWSPDGSRIAFASSRSGSPQIYVMNAGDGSGVRRVSTQGNYNTEPSWAPVGDRIAYSTRGGGGFQIVVAGLDGGGRVISSRGSNTHPSWAPDGRYLVYASRAGGREHLVMSDRDGRSVHELTTGAGDDSSPTWSPRQ
jgi:TolB protein